MSGDLREAIQILAADNARLCDRLIAAEKLADAIRRNRSEVPVYVVRALEAYDATRPS